MKEGRREVGGSNRIGQERVKRQTRSDRWVAWGGGPGFAASKSKKGHRGGCERGEAGENRRKTDAGRAVRAKKRQHQERNKRTEGAMMGREESSEVGIVLIFFGVWRDPCVKKVRVDVAVQSQLWFEFPQAGACFTTVGPGKQASRTGRKGIGTGLDFFFFLADWDDCSEVQDCCWTRCSLRQRQR